jgi:RNA polymerase sigma-70 factor (ECF subfamily)
MNREAEELGDAAKASWGRFLDLFEPLRSDLYRYCRHLTRSPWDAEDMSQDVLARAYVALSCMQAPPPNPRAWLFRVASNLWLNQARYARLRLSEGHPTPERVESSEVRATREAAGTLIAQLSPQERAAVVLKDVFELSLEEVAASLSTSTGAVKAALHRGRTKLSDASEEPVPVPVAPAVLDEFCAAFNAGDLDRLTGLLLETATMEFPGVLHEYGVAALRAGSLRSTLFGCPEGRYTPPAPPRCEVRMHRGESILLWWLGTEVDAVVRVELDQARIAGLRNYRHSPDLAAEVCRELGVPFLNHGYRPNTRSEQ